MRFLVMSSAAFVMLIAGTLSSDAERHGDGNERKPGKVQHEAVSVGSAVRAIDDRSAGVRWLLIQDPAHPAGPGLFIQTSRRDERPNTGHAEALAPAPMIRAGDRVQVEQHTPILDANLEGVALCTAARGALLQVRLKVGGRVVGATALAAGRALLNQQGEAKP